MNERLARRAPALEADRPFPPNLCLYAAYLCREISGLLERAASHQPAFSSSPWAARRESANVSSAGARSERHNRQGL